MCKIGVTGCDEFVDNYLITSFIKSRIFPCCSLVQILLAEYDSVLWDTSNSHRFVNLIASIYRRFLAFDPSCFEYSPPRITYLISIT